MLLGSLKNTGYYDGNLTMEEKDLVIGRANALHDVLARWMTQVKGGEEPMPKINMLTSIADIMGFNDLTEVDNAEG